MDVVTPVLEGRVPPEQMSRIRPSNSAAFPDGLIAVALIDGRIDAREQRLLLDVAQNAGLDTAATKNRMNALAKITKVNQRG